MERTYSKFCRCIIKIRGKVSKRFYACACTQKAIDYVGFKLCSVFSDSDGHANKYGMIQYMFDGPQVEINVKPHGNFKGSTPFFPTSKKTKGSH